MGGGTGGGGGGSGDGGGSGGGSVGVSAPIATRLPGGSADSSSGTYRDSVVLRNILVYTFGNDTIDSLEYFSNECGGRMQECGDYAAQYWANMYNNSSGWYQKLAYGVMGLSASSWTPDTYETTVTILTAGLGAGIYQGRPYWQYYPAGNTSYTSQYITRGWGWEPPYAPPPEHLLPARELGLPPYNPGTAVREINPKWYQFVGGPTQVKPYVNPDYPGYYQPGKGIQYKIWGWP